MSWIRIKKFIVTDSSQFYHAYQYVCVCVCVCVCSIAQLCLILCDPMDHSPPGSSVHGIFPSKNTGVGWRGSSRPRDRTRVSCIAGRLFTTQPLGCLLILKKFPILSSKATMHLSIEYLSKMKTSTLQAPVISEYYQNSKERNFQSLRVRMGNELQNSSLYKILGETWGTWERQLLPGVL